MNNSDLLANLTKSGIPVSKVDVSGQLNATCSGYSWTTRYDPPSGHYEDVEVRLHGKTSDGVPFNVIEGGTGKETMTTMRRIVSVLCLNIDHRGSEKADTGLLEVRDWRTIRMASNRVSRRSYCQPAARLQDRGV